MMSRQLSVRVDGTPGHAGSAGSSGQHGGAAGQPTQGGDAGTIDLFRATDPASPDRVTARIRRAMPGGAIDDTTAVLAAHASVHLSAVGGAGGAGGRGGDGANGRDGTRGRDAFGSTPGSNGGHGSDGGNGGAGTQGAAGGRGGSIIDRVQGTDTDLFAASEWHAAGGPGGAAGAHGRPGRGGHGGAGGNSTSYQRMTGMIEGIPQYTTEYVPGGSRGRDGRSGSAPSAGLACGAAGPGGRVVLEIIDGPAQGTYPDRYRLAASDFVVMPEDGRHFVEFGGTMAAEVTLQNMSAMPTPQATDLVAGIMPGMRLQPTHNVTLPRGMQQGRPERIGGLRFDLAWPGSKTGSDPFVVQLQPTLGVETARGGVPLTEAAIASPQTVAFPLQLTAFEADSVAYAGKPAQAAWTLVNVSDRPVGGDVRAAQTSLRFVDGDTPACLVQFSSADTATPGDLSGALVTPLPHLEPGAGITMRGEVSFASDAEPYSRAKLGLTLGLTPPRVGPGARADNGDAVATLQERTAEIQLAQSYVARADASAILLVNHDTGRQEIEAWREVFGELGMQADIWNVSVYGTDTLTRVFDDARFASSCGGKTLVVLNNAYAHDGGRSALADAVHRGDLLQIAQRAGAATYVVGPTAKIDPRRLVPVPSQTPRPFGSLNKFKAGRASGEAATDRVGGADQIDVRTNRRRPRPEHLTRKTEKLLASLSDAHPERNYTATPAYNMYAHPAHSKKRNHLGSITLLRGLDTPRHVATRLNSSGEGLHDRRFVHGEDNRFALYKTFAFERKLALLHTMSGNASVTDTLVRAIVSDLADEQAMLRAQHTRGQLGRDALVERMVRLKTLTTDPWLSGQHEAAPFAQRIHAAMEAMLRARWYHHVRPWHRRRIDVDAATLRLLKNLPPQAPGAAPPVAVAPPPGHAYDTEFTLRGATRIIDAS